jgi:GNAT superfamily N-acetyltransferase
MARRIDRFTVRPATPADSASILACLESAFEPYRDRYTAQAFLDTVLTPATLAERFASMAVFVAVDSADQVVGTIAGRVLEAGQGHLRGMAVRPGWQGTGVARELLSTVERHLREAGCSRITLGTVECLQAARRFYEKNGYRLSGQGRDFFGMQLEEHLKQLVQSQPS